MQGTSWTLHLAFAAAFVGNCECLGIGFDHGVHSGTVAVRCVYARQVLLGQTADGEFGVAEVPAQGIEGNFVQLSVGAASNARRLST